MARPACPAPIMTVVMLRIWSFRKPDVAARGEASVHHDGNIRWVCHDVVDRRTLLRLRNESFDVLSFRIGIDLIGHLDAAEAIADVLVHAEDALDVHISFDDCRDRPQLNITVLGYR